MLAKKSDSLVPELSRNDIFSVRDFNEQRIIGAGALQGYKSEKIGGVKKYLGLKTGL